MIEAIVGVSWATVLMAFILPLRDSLSRVPSAIVVGAGVFGASTADRLARDGWEVTLVDRYPPGHVRAASGGESRLMRASHADGRWYQRSSRRARDLWHELEDDLGVELLIETGVVWFARSEDGWEAASERALREDGVPVERLDPSEGERFFPSFNGDDLSHLLLEPEGGILLARRATQALATRAIEAGAEFLGGVAEPDGDGVRVRGDRLEADAVVWACGGWLPQLFPGVLRVRVSRQDEVYVGAGIEWHTPPVPGFVDYDGAFYGVGDADGRGVKIGDDRDGPDFEPDRGSRMPTADVEERVRGHLANRFPELADAPVIGTRACQYAITPDSNFIVAPLPEHRSVWLLGGDSGHGFKHGPALAEYVARLVGGEEEPDPVLGLGERSGDRSLRTAGGSPGEAG
jgi:glycine/D-amino acid oxidase-like deaminating enzyme